jgi:hypothetical protein
VTLLVLWGLSAGMWVVSRYRDDLVGAHRVFVRDGRVVEEWFGLYNGDDRIAFGGTRSSDLPAAYRRYVGRDAEPFSEYGHFERQPRAVFAEGDDPFFAGLGLATGRRYSSPVPGSAPRRGVPPVFEFEHERNFVSVPWWFVLAGITLVMAWRLNARLNRRIAARRRESCGYCPACAYDCRATPERCPECGTSLAASANTLK